MVFKTANYSIRYNRKTLFQTFILLALFIKDNNSSQLVSVYAADHSKPEKPISIQGLEAGLAAQEMPTQDSEITEEESQSPALLAIESQTSSGSSTPLAPILRLKVAPERTPEETPPAPSLKLASASPVSPELSPDFFPAPTLALQVSREIELPQSVEEPSHSSGAKKTNSSRTTRTSSKADMPFCPSRQLRVNSDEIMNVFQKLSNRGNKPRPFEGVISKAGAATKRVQTKSVSFSRNEDEVIGSDGSAAALDITAVQDNIIDVEDTVEQIASAAPADPADVALSNPPASTTALYSSENNDHTALEMDEAEEVVGVIKGAEEAIREAQEASIVSIRRMPKKTDSCENAKKRLEKLRQEEKLHKSQEALAARKQEQEEHGKAEEEEEIEEASISSKSQDAERTRAEGIRKDEERAAKICHSQERYEERKRANKPNKPTDDIEKMVRRVDSDFEYFLDETGKSSSLIKFFSDGLNHPGNRNLEHWNTRVKVTKRDILKVHTVFMLVYLCALVPIITEAFGAEDAKFCGEVVYGPNNEIKEEPRKMETRTFRDWAVVMTVGWSLMYWQFPTWVLRSKQYWVDNDGNFAFDEPNLTALRTMPFSIMLSGVVFAIVSFFGAIVTGEAGVSSGCATVAGKYAFGVAIPGAIVFAVLGVAFANSPDHRFRGH